MDKGFYKFDDMLLYAENFVINKDYELFANQKETYSYPVDGWYWFNTLHEACSQFNLNIDDYLPKEEKVINDN